MDFLKSDGVEIMSNDCLGVDLWILLGSNICFDHN